MWVLRRSPPCRRFGINGSSTLGDLPRPNTPGGRTLRTSGSASSDQRSRERRRHFAGHPFCAWSRVSMARRRRGRAGRRRQAASASVTMLEQRLGERPLGDPLTPVLLEHLRRVCRRQRMPVPLPWRHHICRGCHGPLRPGHEARVRIRNRQRITTCLTCGRVHRFGPWSKPSPQED